MALDSDKLAALRIDPEQRSDRRGGRIVLVLAVAATLAALLAWLGLRGAGGSDPAAPALQTVPAEAPRARAAASAVLEASGFVVARRLATVSSKITGRIADVLIEEGMAVDAGQLLASLDDSTQQAQLALARSQLESARRGLAETQVRLAEARRQLERTRTLREQRLASEAELDAAASEVEALRARLEVSRSNVAVAERTVALREQDLQDLQIRAPFAGVIISKDAQPGEMISPAASGGFTRTGICTIVDMQSREIEVDVNEAYINRVRPGQAVVARLDAYPDWDIPGSVINIVPTADRQKATVRVRIAFDELDPRMLPDMGINVGFLEPETDPRPTDEAAVALVPEAALRPDGDTDYVWVVSDERLERRAVRRGRRVAGAVEILAGLAPGERVVTVSDGRLEEGRRVRLD